MNLTHLPVERHSTFRHGLHEMEEAEAHAQSADKQFGVCHTTGHRVSNGNSLARWKGDEGSHLHDWNGSARSSRLVLPRGCAPQTSKMLRKRRARSVCCGRQAQVFSDLGGDRRSVLAELC